MSTLIMSQCWPLQMAAPKKAVLVSLADNANDQGVCWPSVASIAMRTCLSERTVQMAVAWLLANHYLRISDRAGRSSVYQIVLPEPERHSPDMRTAPPQQVHPRTACTPAGAAPHPRTRCTPPPQELHPTPAPHAPRTVKEPKRNHQGTVIGQAALPAMPPPPPPPKPEPPVPAALKNLDTRLLPEITPAVWADYLLHRKRKRAPLTQSALAMLAAELHKAVAVGMTADQALSEAMAMGWTGLRLEWLQRPADRGPGSSSSSPTAGRRVKPESPLAAHRRTFMGDMVDFAAGLDVPRTPNSVPNPTSRTVDVDARTLF